MEFPFQGLQKIHIFIGTIVFNMSKKYGNINVNLVVYPFRFWEKLAKFSAEFVTSVNDVPNSFNIPTIACIFVAIQSF